MNKLLIITILLFASTLTFSQEKEINGSITNTVDVAGIYIQNQSSRYHAVTHNDGTFKIKVKVKDTLVITSITYMPQKIVVSETAYNQSTLTITLKEAVNELAEVKLGNQLSEEDREQLNAAKEDLKNDLSWEKMEFDYEFTQDKFSSIEGNKAYDALFNGQKQNDGIKLHMIVPAVIKFLKRKETEVLPQLPKDVVRFYLKRKYTKEDLQSYFDIPPAYAEDFLYFLVDEGMPDAFLDDNNALKLTQLIGEKAALYNAKAKE